MSITRRAALAAALASLSGLALSRPAAAHLATWGSWDITRTNLGVLFPKATRYLRKRYAFSEAEVRGIESFLGFTLYPEDRTPEFYIAVRERDGRRELLGVALFIDPRVKPRVVGGEVVRLEVGVGVDNKGRIARVAIYDYKGDPALTSDAFLGQLRGRTLEHDFTVSAKAAKGRGGLPAISPVPGEPEESQLIANAAREALYLMKVALGR
ncbi:MAG: hypothetical protein CMH57_01700 [Myxococcales bacterium]|nr:hypothetical protein [Myxococcales bacterium]